MFLAVFSIWCLASRNSSLPCPTWLGWLVELDNPFTKTKRASEIIKRLDLQPGMKVLDSGCGPGRLTIPIAKQVGSGGEVFAVDIQPGMLQRTKEKAHKENLKNIQFIQSASGESKIGTDKFDRALLVTVLGEIPEREKGLKEIFNALKPGGILSITEIIFDPHFQQRKTVISLATQIGFKEKQFFRNSMAYTLNLEKTMNC